MADQTPDEGAPDDQGSVFGNLPSSRPGARSPRRRSTAAGAAESSPEEAPKPKPRPKRAAKPAAAAPPPPPPPPPPPAEPSADADAQRPGVEDVAWAGITVAAQAATAGVRFASRALEAARKSIDRT